MGEAQSCVDVLEGIGVFLDGCQDRIYGGEKRGSTGCPRRRARASGDNGRLRQRRCGLVGEARRRVEGAEGRGVCFLCQKVHETNFVANPFFTRCFSWKESS